MMESWVRLYIELDEILSANQLLCCSVGLMSLRDIDSERRNYYGKL